MRKLIVFVVIVILSAFLFFIFNKDENITNYPSEGRDIIAFGYSLVVGVGASREENIKKFEELGSRIVVLHNAEHITEASEPAILSEFLSLTK